MSVSFNCNTVSSVLIQRSWICKTFYWVLFTVISFRQILQKINFDIYEKIFFFSKPFLLLMFPLQKYLVLYAYTISEKIIYIRENFNCNCYDRIRYLKTFFKHAKCNKMNSHLLVSSGILHLAKLRLQENKKIHNIFVKWLSLFNYYPFDKVI